MSRLHLQHFRLQHPPFDITPDPGVFFAGAQRGALCDAIEHAIFDTPGIVLVVGEVGGGKTMLCRLLAQRLQARACDLIYLANPAFAPQEILRSMLADLGEPSDADAPLLRLQQALLARHQRGRSVVLLIDEAQAMPTASIEEIKLLSNLETAQHKLLQIVLFGQPEIETVLANPQLRQVRDRVVNRFVIPPLDSDDAVRYLQHRLSCAGSGGQAIFAKSALLLLARQGHGSMRRLNILADQALLAAYAAGSAQVQAQHVRQAIRALPAAGRSRSRRWQRIALLASLALAAATGVLVVGLSWWRSTPASGIATFTAPAAPVSQTMTATPPASAAATSAGETAQAPTDDALAARYTALPPALRAQVLRSRAFLDDTAQQGYTVQIVIHTRLQDLQRWLRLPWPADWPLWVHDRHYPGTGPVWTLYVGHFAHREQAAAALQQLPPSATSMGAFVRSLEGIRAEAYPESLPSL